jgi:hypothetical protein
MVIDGKVGHAAGLPNVGKPRPMAGGLRWDRCLSTASAPVETGEDDRRLDLLHQNVRKYATVSNTVATATKLEGVIKRKI